jgi:hypothetical protein
LNRNGIGLGLVIIDKIVKKFDGVISFESIPNEGSTFIFSFKLQAAQDYHIGSLKEKNFEFRWQPDRNILEQEVHYVQSIK